MMPLRRREYGIPDVLKNRKNQSGCHHVQLALSTFKASFASGNALIISAITGMARSSPPATIRPPYSEEPASIAIESEMAKPTSTKTASNHLDRRSRTSSPPCLARSMIPELIVRSLTPFF